MTVADSGALHGEGGWPFRLAMQLGHFYKRRANLVLTGQWTLLVAGWWLTPVAGLLRWLAFAVACVAIACITCEMFVHDRNLCLRDLQEAPLMDPQGAVDRSRRTLRTYHDRRFTVIVTLLSLCPIIAVTLVPGRAGVSPTLKIVLTVAAVVGVAVIAGAGRIQSVHRRLRPWCPWCRRDDGPGDEVSAPTPDPVGTARH